MTTILGIRLNNRIESSITFQEVLSKYGCIIKTRIGLHPTCSNICSRFGIILLEITDRDEVHNLESELRTIKGLKTNTMEL